MKTTLHFLLLFLSVTFCFAQKKKLSLNLTKGETYNQIVSSKILINQTVNGQPVNMDMTISGKMTYKVLDLKDQLFDMEVQYESLSMSMKLPNVTMEFSSEKKDEKDILSSILSGMKNKPFYITMSDDGRVKKVSKIDELFSNAFKNFPDITEAQKQQIQN